MSAGLHIRVGVSFRGEDLINGTGVLANVYPSERGRPALRDLLIPAGEGVPFHRLEVEPGRYVVEVVMPSGRLLSEEAQVGEGQEVMLDLEDRDSPHESHSWQYFSGNVEAGGAYRAGAHVPPSRSYGSGRFRVAPTDARFDLNDPFFSPTLAVQWIPHVRSAAWSFAGLNQIAHAQARGAASDRVAEAPPVSFLEATETDGTLHLYRFNSQGPVGTGPRHRAALGARQFLLVTAGNDSYLATLPVPWTSPAFEDVQVEVLVNARPSPTGSPIGVTVRDRILGAGLAYLATGALLAARRVFDDVEQMLYDKMINPYAAAAAGYVLVGTESARATKPWHAWLDNLRTRFPWMSDGSILWASHTLRHAADEAEVRAAKEALVEACGRGVPFFTLGLTWLMEGLSDFPDDPECIELLDGVRRLSWRVDTRQPFLVHRLNRPAS